MRTRMWSFDFTSRFFTRFLIRILAWNCVRLMCCLVLHLFLFFKIKLNFLNQDWLEIFFISASFYRIDFVSFGFFGEWKERNELWEAEKESVLLFVPVNLARQPSVLFSGFFTWKREVQERNGFEANPCLYHYSFWVQMQNAVGNW